MNRCITLLIAAAVFGCEPSDPQAETPNTPAIESPAGVKKDGPLYPDPVGFVNRHTINDTNGASGGLPTIDIPHIIRVSSADETCIATFHYLKSTDEADEYEVTISTQNATTASAHKVMAEYRGTELELWKNEQWRVAIKPRTAHHGTNSSDTPEVP